LKLKNSLTRPITHPAYETEDYQGVRDVLAVIHDSEVIHKIVNVLRNELSFLQTGTIVTKARCSIGIKTKIKSSSHGKRSLQFFT